MGFIATIKIKIKKFIIQVVGIIIKHLPFLYYSKITKLPLYNWFEVKKGNINYLFRFNIFNFIPTFFFTLVMDLFYQFDSLDLGLLRKKSDYMFLKSYAIRTKDKNLMFRADSLQKEIEDIEKRGTDISLNEFIDFIELSFNCAGTIDPFKISTSRAFSLFNKAVKKQEINTSKNVHNIK